MYRLALFVSQFPLDLIAVIVDKDCTKRQSYKHVKKIVPHCNFLDKYHKFFFVTFINIDYRKPYPIVDYIDYMNKPALNYIRLRYHRNLITSYAIKIYNGIRYVGKMNYRYSEIRMKRFIPIGEKRKRFLSWYQAKRYMLLKREFGWLIADLIISFEKPHYLQTNRNFIIVKQ